MQLEMLYMQSVLLAKTRWTDQLKVQMDQTRTKLVLVYWAGGSPASKWARPFDQQIDKSTMIDIFVSEDTGAFNVRDEFKGLIQKAGIGASIQLSGLDNAEKSKAVSALKYPKNQLKVFWGGSDKLYTKTKLLVSVFLLLLFFLFLMKNINEVLT